MDFSLTTVYVLPIGGTLATSGDSSALTAGQLGMFKADLSAPAVAADQRIRFAMGRFPKELTTLSKKSDIIDKNRIIDYYTVPAIPSGVTKQVTINGFNVHCGEQVSVTIRAFSDALSSVYSNGWTESFMALAPCCDCDSDPCDTVDAQALVDDLVAQINASDIKDYVGAARTGSAGTSALVLTAKIPPALNANDNNIAYNQYTLDYVDLFAYVYKGAFTSMDDLIYDRCDVAGTVTYNREVVLARGSGKEVQLIEWQHSSYQNANFKQHYNNDFFDINFVTNAVPSAFYTEFVIKFRPLEGNATWGPHSEYDETVRIFASVDDADDIKTALDAWVGVGEKHTEDRPFITTFHV